MAPSTAVVTCPNCGRKNRIAPSAEGIPRCAVCHHALPWAVDATASTFDTEVRASVPVLVDFWAPWCGPCRMVSPAVERLAVEMAGRLKVVKLNTDEAPDVAERFAVQGIPLLVLMRDGAEADRRVGALPESELRRWLEPQVGSAPAPAPSAT
ncbi:MAG: thioredoxin 2 [Solirubrobacteraceae bacterium]|jgi:thioredoxin 2|nr:thioredoxin 2 [Solirubrobacteraceae bacterium]